MFTSSSSFKLSANAPAFVPSSTSSQPKKFKLVLIGDGGVGKTVLTKRRKTGEFEKKYITTMGVEVSNLCFHTSAGEIIFNIWDTAGQEKFSGLGDCYYNDADAAIIMFDVTAKCTYRSVPEYYEKFTTKCPSASVVLCGNKVDCKNRRVNPKDITFHRQVNIQYYDISAKSNYNFEKPFLHIIRNLLKDNNIHYIEAPVFVPSSSISIQPTKLVSICDGGVGGFKMKYTNTKCVVPLEIILTQQELDYYSKLVEFPENEQ